MRRARDRKVREVERGRVRSREWVEGMMLDA
jgi:hypothetical protein